MDILKDTALSTETLHLLQTFCTFDRCSASHLGCSAPLATVLHLQSPLRPAKDTLYLIMTPGTSERRSVSLTNSVHQRLTYESDRNSASLTDTVHLFSHQNLLQVLLQTLCPHLKLNISAPYVLIPKEYLLLQ
jgi:hypothetical protein